MTPNQSIDKHTEILCKTMWRTIAYEWPIQAWRKLGDELKKIIIAERVVFTFTGQDRDDIRSTEILSLYFAMLKFCGLGEDTDA